MHDELADRHADALAATVGDEGRMLAWSKSGYLDRHPEHVVVFNGNLCLEAGKLWNGDLDLTLDEPLLAALAQQIGETVYLLSERDGRFEHEQAPLLDRAVYSVTPSGHSRYQHRWFERAADGSLRQRPPAPASRRRFLFKLARPRLLDIRRRQHLRYDNPDSYDGRSRGHLYYVGARQPDRTGPLLVLGLHILSGWRSWVGLELTWYPSDRRHAPQPLLQLSLQPPRNRSGPYLSLTIHPGLDYRLHTGIRRRDRR